MRPASWSPDALKLFCTTKFSGTFVYSFESRSYERLTDSSYATIEAPAVWLNDSRRLLMAREGRLLLIDSRSRNTNEVLSLPPDFLFWPRLSRDNRQIFFARAIIQSDIYMLSFK